MPAREKFVNKIRANKAGSACDEAIHGLERRSMADFAAARREIPQQFFTTAA